MRENESINAFKNSWCNILSILSVGWWLSNHGFKHLTLKEARLSFLTAAVSDPLLGKHQLLCMHFLLQLYSIDDNTIGSLDYLFEVVYWLYRVYLGKNLSLTVSEDVSDSSNISLPDGIRDSNEVKLAVR
jgi:hypothetical protein